MPFPLEAANLLLQAGLFRKEVLHPLGEAGELAVEALDLLLDLLVQGPGPGGLGLQARTFFFLGGHVLPQGQEGEEKAKPKPKPHHPRPP